MSEDAAPYATQRRFVALGKVGGLWHVVSRTPAGVRHLLPLSPRRRRAFTPAELVTAERFDSLREARGAGRGCGFERTYALAEPGRNFPAAAALRRRPILTRLRPQDGTEAAALTEYVASHQEDAAAIASLPKPELERAVLLLLLRSADLPES